MQRLDSHAAAALTMLEDDDPRITREPQARSAWSRFIMSLLMRTPQDVVAIKKGVAEEWARHIPGLEARYAAERMNDPITFDEYIARRGSDYINQRAISLLPYLIDHKWIGKASEQHAMVRQAH
jgi:hypothetical protein